MKYISNILTSLNLFSGFMSIFFSIEGRFLQAFYFIVLGLIFDMLDGRIARALKISSKFGIEFDSLADLITFGLAPSILMYLIFLKEVEFGKIIAFIPLIAVAIRLARFNANFQSRGSEYFEGLSSPLGAFTLVSATMLAELYEFKNTLWGKTAIIIIIFVISSLEVSSLNFRSFKDMKLSRALLTYLLILPPALLWLIFFKPKIFFIVILTLSFTYILYNIIFENLKNREKGNGKGLHIRYNAKRWGTSSRVHNDLGRESEDGISSGETRS